MWMHRSDNAYKGSSLNGVYRPCKDTSPVTYAEPTKEYLDQVDALMVELDQEIQKVRLMPINENDTYNSVFPQRGSQDLWEAWNRRPSIPVKDRTKPSDLGLSMEDELREQVRERDEIIERLKARIYELELEKNAETDLADIEQIDSVLETVT